MLSLAAGLWWAAGQLPPRAPLCALRHPNATGAKIGVKG